MLQALMIREAASAFNTFVSAGWDPDPRYTEEKVLELFPHLWQVRRPSGGAAPAPPAPPARSP
jgi:hypothetical protein